MSPCTICGELFDELELEPSPSGSGKMLCGECAVEVELDLAEMHNAMTQEILDEENE